MKTLTKEDLPIGTKVVPHDKTNTEWGSKEESKSWKALKKQGFLYVLGYDSEDNCLVLWHELKATTTGDFYNYSDVTIYEEK